MLNYAMK